MKENEPNEQAESVDLLTYQRTKPLHGHVITDCYFPLSVEDAFFQTFSGKPGTPSPTCVRPSLPSRNEKPSTGPKKEPCIIETIPKSRIPVALPFKPEKNHPTKGGSRDEPEPLFAEFAKCDNAESIIRFADKYGRLTTERVGLPDEADHTKFQTVPGEPLRLWEYEAGLVKLAQTFWLADPDFVKERIIFETDNDTGGRAVYYYRDWIGSETLSKRSPLVKHNGFGSRHLEYLPEGDYTAAARFIAASMVNEALYRRHPAYSTLTAKAVGEFDLRIAPRSLISLIWHSLAEAIQGQRTIRRCIVCGQLIEVHGPTSRMIFHESCGGQIRVRRSRYKDIYSAMISAGKPLPEVAKACRTSIQVLEYWLALDAEKKGGSDK